MWIRCCCQWQNPKLYIRASRSSEPYCILSSPYVESVLPWFWCWFLLLTARRWLCLDLTAPTTPLVVKTSIPGLLVPSGNQWPGGLRTGNVSCIIIIFVLNLWLIISLPLPGPIQLGCSLMWISIPATSQATRRTTAPSLCSAHHVCALGLHLGTGATTLTLLRWGIALGFYHIWQYFYMLSFDKLKIASVDVVIF